MCGNEHRWVGILAVERCLHNWGRHRIFQGASSQPTRWLSSRTFRWLINVCVFEIISRERHTSMPDIDGIHQKIQIWRTLDVCVGTNVFGKGACSILLWCTWSDRSIQSLTVMKDSWTRKLGTSNSERGEPCRCNYERATQLTCIRRTCRPTLSSTMGSGGKSVHGRSRMVTCSLMCVLLTRIPYCQQCVYFNSGTIAGWCMVIDHHASPLSVHELKP